jgi:aryl-alcohol dehydrogenase-like predicted oxidoreductase
METTVTRLRRLGQTDMELSPIGLGCWQFSQRGFSKNVWEALDQDTMDAVVTASLRHGVTWFDTAAVYGNGLSELALSTALRNGGVRPGEVVVATKWQPIGKLARDIGRSIDVRLEKLQGYPIDLFQVHNPFSFSSVTAQMREMAALVHQGKVRSVGVSNFSARQMEKAAAVLAAEGLPLASNQVPISLVDRRIETNGVFAAAKRLGVTLIAYSPLAQCLLTGRLHDDPACIASLPRGRRARISPAGRFASTEGLERSRPLIDGLREIAAAHGATMAQIALAAILTAYGDTVVAIPGASRPEQAVENAEAMGLRLSHKEMARLDELSQAVARH